jgi:magnesium chelatase subunit D
MGGVEVSHASDLLPFSAVVGQEQAKLALVLTAVDPRIGGVLLRGDKGSAKSTLARGLADLLPGGAPFVELPIGATEDRVVGTLDLTAALTGGETRLAPGLLAAAHDGVLYVDEINLLPDHLVDVLLDVAASGVNRVEREGVSQAHASRFLLIGSMNPEEGDLRPQLLDRFGLAVEVRTADDPAERAAAVRTRLEFDAAPEDVRRAHAAAESALAARLAAARPAALGAGIVESVSALCSSVGAEGLRADLTICRAAAALAGWEGREQAGAEEVRRVAAMALAHRARRHPMDSSGLDHDALSQELDEQFGPRPEDGGRREEGDGVGGPREVGASGADGAGAEGAGADWGGTPPPAPLTVGPVAAGRDRSQISPAAGRRTPAEARRGRTIGDRAPDGPIRAVAVGATVRRAAGRQLERAAPGLGLVEPGDLREAVKEQKSANLIVIAVDTSGSMGARDRMNAAKGAVLGLLRDAYQRRDLVSLVTFRGEGAEVVLKPTGSVEVARARLGEIPTGGRTPLAAGIEVALRVAVDPGRLASHRPLLVLVTDGRATSGPVGADPVDAALVAAASVRSRGVDSVVIDVEAAGPNHPGGSRLGLAGSVAAAMGARHLPVTELTPASLQHSVRRAASSRG